MTRSPSPSLMPRTPIESRPLNTRTSVTGKRMHWPFAVVSSTSASSVQIWTSTMSSPSSSFIAILPARLTCAKSRQLVAPDRAARRREHHVERRPVGLVLRQWHDRRDALALLERQHVDQRLAARLRRRKRQAPDLFLVDLAARGEEQHRRMGRGDEQPRRRNPRRASACRSGPCRRAVARDRSRAARA